MGLLLKAAKLALLLGLSAAADDALSTCGGLKSAYKSAQCCGSKGKKALDQQYEPLKRAHVPRADYNETSGDYDFVMAGSGTGGLGLAGKLASVAEDHPDFRMLIVEAGRWLEPSLLRLPFTLTRSWADGTVRVEHHTKQLPVNWVAAVDNWLRAYEMAGTTAPGPRPANFFFETYTYLLTSPDYMSFVSTLRGHLKTVVDDPNNSQQILAEDLPNVTIQLIESNASNTGVVQPNMDAADSTTFEGNPLVLLDPVWLEIRRNQLIAGYGTSEDIFYHDAFYSTSTSGYLQNYPRGKTLGGSSVVNAGVHYGLTDKVLDQLADLSGNSEFSSAHTANIVKGSVTLTSQCSDWSSPLPNECRGPVYGWNTQDYDDMAPIEHRKMLGDTPGVYPDITYSQVADEFYKRSKQPHDKTISSADFEEAKREKARSATESINPFSKIRSTSADALVNLLARGIKVCFYASSNPLVLSKRVLPAKYDCDVHPESPVHIRTGAFVTEIEFDPNDPKRATGLRWVNEHEQYQPDQNRFYREKDASCDVAKSLYGVGENNSADCDNRLYYFEMLNANPNVTSEQKTEMAQRAAIATQELLTDGKKNHPGRGANYQFLEPESQKTLRPAVNEHVETAKKEVILALGAPATTAMLMRSGISTKEDSQRLGTHLRSELEVGAMNDNYEGFYTLATPNVAVATKWCQDIFDMQARGQGTIQSSYLTGDDADPREPLSKNIHPDGFYLRFRNTADGDYHMNLQ